MKYCKALLVAVMVMISGVEAASFENAIAKHDAHGNKFVVWEEMHGGERRVFSATQSKDQRSWSEPILLSKKGVDSVRPQIAINNDGNAVCVWYANETDLGVQSIYGAMLPAGGIWTTAQRLSPADQTVRGDISLEINPQNSILVVWSAYSHITKTNFLCSRQGAFPNNWFEPYFISEVEADR